MIKDKRVIGVCIARIHDTRQITYLNHLHNYAQSQGYKLIVFNSFSDFDNSNTFHDDAGAIYNVINFNLIDALVIDTISLCNGALTASLTEKAKLHGIPILS